MCVVCGCGDPVVAPPEGVKVDPVTGDLDYGAGAARVSVPGLSQARTVKLEADVLGENDRIANVENIAQHRRSRIAVGILLGSVHEGINPSDIWR